MSKAGEKLIAAAKEAVAIAKGEQEPARVHEVHRLPGITIRLTWDERDENGHRPMTMKTIIHPRQPRP